MSLLKRYVSLICAFTIALLSAGSLWLTPVQAASNMYLAAEDNVATGQTITISVYVNTNGQSANSFEGTISYPGAKFEGITGSYSGSICTLPIMTPEPSGGTAKFSCGRPGGYTGTGKVAQIVLRALTEGTVGLSLGGCTVLANDGQGTAITGGCTGKTITITGATVNPTTPTPTPTPNGGSGTVNTPRPTNSAGGGAGRTPTPTPFVPTVAPEQGGTPTTPDPNAITPPDVATLPESTPLPEGSELATNNEAGPRTIAGAIQEIFQSSKDFGNLKASPAGVIAVMVTTIPFMGLAFAILFLAYRLYTMERKRRRTLDRLFEMELAELAALEGKLDLLAGKGTQGREQYREEFQKAKENILRQLKPSYNKKDEPEPAKTEEKK